MPHCCPRPAPGRPAPGIISCCSVPCCTRLCQSGAREAEAGTGLTARQVRPAPDPVSAMPCGAVPCHALPCSTGPCHAVQYRTLPCRSGPCPEMLHRYQPVPGALPGPCPHVIRKKETKLSAPAPSPPWNLLPGPENYALKAQFTGL